MLTRDQMLRESRARGGSLSGLLAIYGVLIAVMALTASAIV